MRRILLSTITVILFAVPGISQLTRQVIFNRITKEDGLASNMTFQTLRDKQGFLWIGTQNGLQRYDGNRFLTFRHIPGDSTTVSENSINHLFIDNKDRLWVIFDTRLGLFNTTQFTFAETKISAPINMIKKITQDREGRIILFADSKLFVYDEASRTFLPNYPLPPLPPGYNIGDMIPEPNSGGYWITGKQGSLLYDPKTKQIDSRDQVISYGKMLDSLFAIKNARYPFIAQDGTWWLVNWIPFTGPAPVLYNYNKTTNQLQQYSKFRPYKADSYYEIWSVFQQSSGTIWIYGMGLLAYYNPTENRFINIKSDPFQKNGIEYDMINSLYEDQEKNVWVSTNKGLYRFNTDAQVFRNLVNIRINDTAASPRAVSTVIETQSQGIWVSTWGGGIFSYNEQLQPIANPVSDASAQNRDLHISAMTQLRNGEVWIGLISGELKIYEPGTNKISSLPNPMTNGEGIQQIFEDREGNTWIGSNLGRLIKCEKGNWRDSTTSFKLILSDIGDIFKFYQDKPGNLWVCTASTGVYELDIKTGKVIRQFTETDGKNDGLLNAGATDIVQYNDSLYIIASDGLCIFNNKKNSFRYLTAADGLPSEHITALILDQKHRLWVACDGGLYRMNIDNQFYITTFDAAEGITSNVFQVSAGNLLRDGRVVFGTIHDFLVFDPEQTVDKNPVPPVKITGFSLGSTQLSVDSLQKLEELVLPYDNTFLNIQLSTLHLRLEYSMDYMLEGLDKDWKRVNNSEITYQYLPPGSYTLKLRSRNGEGAETTTITTLKIRVTPPFWKTWWFYGLLILVIGGVLFWLDHERIKRKTAMLEMRSNIADGLYKDINEALSNITILSEMAKIKASKEPEKAKEFIEQIHTKSENMMLAMDDILWSIDPNNDSMENFMLRFREYVDQLKSQYNTAIDVLSDKKSEGLKLKMEIRNDLFWLFKGGVTNVLKTGGKNCRIHISYEKAQLIYTLEFDTAGVDMKQLDNIRLRNELSEKLNKLGARLEFKEYSNNASFELTVPLRGNV